MRSLGALPIALLILGMASVASAQESTSVAEPEADTTSELDGVDVRAPRRAFELSVQGGYIQPFGQLTERTDIDDVVEAGGTVGIQLGYRATPHWSIEGTTEFHDSSEGERLGPNPDVDIHGLSGGVQATYHFLPFNRVDPVLSFGTGYRAMWFLPESAVEPVTVVHGIQALRATFGLDIRASDSVALGPMVGADMTVFLRETQGNGTGQSIDEPGLSTFLFAGMGARFDMGGQRVPVPSTVAIVEQVPTPAAGPPPAPRPSAPPPAPTGVKIDADILAICKIEAPKAYFAFDKADVQAKAFLTRVAECFTTGPLKGRRVTVVGRADPRGTDDYNLKLGQSRASAVAGQLTESGMAPGTVGTDSRGEAEAIGQEESGWAFDRRVDLKLQPQ